MKSSELYHDMFPQNIRQVVVSCIYLASEMSKELRDSMISIPRRASMLAGHAFPVFIDKLLANQIDQIEVGKFPYNYREITIPKCGHSYIEYHSSIGKFHIKKSDNPKRLPKAAIHRISNAQSNKIFLDYGPEFIPENISVPFALVTYGHKKFKLEYAQIGFPTWDYTKWNNDQCFDISNDISTEFVERIKKEAAGKLKEEYQEKITQTFDLKLK